MIKNIVFDIGNVLVTFYPATHFAPYFKSHEKSERYCGLIFSHEAWGLYDQGIYQMDDIKEIYRRDYPQDYIEIEYILKNWLNLMKLMPETLNYMKELKARGYRIYLLSNISGDSAEYLKQCMPFFDIADGEILSYRVKLNKPDEAIYQALLESYHLEAEETIFFDDNFLNIEQAIHMGIHGVRFTDIDHAKEEAETIIRRMNAC